MAAKDFSAMAEQVIQGLGGKGNLAHVNHCATRLRVTVKSADKVNVSALKKVKGVLGVELTGTQCQVIVGQVIEDLFLAVNKSVGELDVVVEEKKTKRSVGEVFKDFLLLVAGILSPVIPTLIVAGFLSTVLTVMTLAFGIDQSNTTYQILYNFSQSAFYFLPIFVAYTSAKKFDTEPVLAMLLAAGLVYPGWVSMVTDAAGPITLFGLPVPAVKYNGAVVQVILSVWIMAKLDVVLKRAIPEIVRHFLKPFVLLLIMIVITLTLTGPLGALVTNYITDGVNWIATVAPWLCVCALVTFSLTVGVAVPGFHLALVAIATTNIDTIGYDNLINVYFFCNTIACGWLALAIFFKSRNSECRQIALPAALASLFGGISEPCKYGLLFRMPKTYYAYMATSIPVSVVAGLMGLKCYAFGGYSLTNILLYLGPNLDYANFYNAIICAALLGVLAFVTVFVLGFDDSSYGDEKDEEAAAALSDVALSAPCPGAYVPQAKISDNTFASGILGPCFGTRPAEPTICAPVAGTVFSVADTGHAVTILTDGGAEVLVHVGIDSVRLEGKGLEVLVKKGDAVSAGAPLVRYDKAVFDEAGIDDTVVCALLNGASFSRVEFQKGDVALLGIA